MIEKKVLDYSEALKKLGIVHTIADHPDLKKQQDVVGYLGLSITDALPTLIMRADNAFIALVRRGGTQLNLKKLKKELGLKNLRMATEEEFTSITGVPVGAARVYTPGIKTFLDKKIFEAEYLIGASGSFTQSIKHITKDLKKIPNSTVVDIADSQKKRVYSGIRATGRLHLGNYMGAVKGMLTLQDQYECVFSVVDLHALTTPYNSTALQRSIREIVLDYLAAGLDPEKCLLEIQSYIPQHTELAFLLSTIYPVSRLEDLPTYKDKKAQHPKYINMGLLYYPVLMAADILLYKADLVPVGIDQEPHLEVSREIARKFNSMFGETFPEPQRFATPGEYVPSLTGKGKMGKSVEGSYISLGDNLEMIKKRLATAPTDTGKTGGEIPTEGGVSNLFALLALFGDKDMFIKFENDYRKGQIRYSEMKNTLAETVYKELQPLHEKRKYFEENPKVVDEILEKNKKICLEKASETMQEVKEKMGLL